MFKIAMRLNKILIGIVLLFLVNISNLLAADEFPMFKSDVARSAVNPSAALMAPFTISWTSTNNLGSTNAVAYSSPVVFGSQTYIGSVDGTLSLSPAHLRLRPMLRSGNTRQALRITGLPL
jgi:hypothetical protein